MGLLDNILSKSAAQAPMERPEKGSFLKPGYFDWKKQATGPNKNEIIGVILPPYASWLNERIAAAQTGTSFTTPFYVGYGKHAVGPTQKNKVYCECQQSLLDMNKTKEGYPLLPPEAIAAGRNCPLCNIAWNEIWPTVEQWKVNTASAEYKTWKDAHKQATPGVRYLFNFLPMGSAAPQVLDIPKTCAEAIMNIQWDQQQPDLLWPYSLQNWQNAWIKITKKEDPHKTEYTVVPMFVGTPAVIDNNQKFNEAGYLKIVGEMKDLRQEALGYMPKQEDIDKAIAKLAVSVQVKLSINQGVVASINQATAGHQPVMAPTAPAIAPAMSQPTSMMPPLPGGPVMPPAGMQPMMSTPMPTAMAPTPMPMPAAMAPTPMAMPTAVPTPGLPPQNLTPMPMPAAAPAGGTPQATQTFEMLQSLLGPKK